MAFLLSELVYNLSCSIWKVHPAVIVSNESDVHGYRNNDLTAHFFVITHRFLPVNSLLRK